VQVKPKAKKKQKRKKNWVKKMGGEERVALFCLVFLQISKNG